MNEQVAYVIFMPIFMFLVIGWFVRGRMSTKACSCGHKVANQLGAKCPGCGRIQ